MQRCGKFIKTDSLTLQSCRGFDDGAWCDNHSRLRGRRRSRSLLTDSIFSRMHWSSESKPERRNACASMAWQQSRMTVGTLTLLLMIRHAAALSVIAPKAPGIPQSLVSNSNEKSVDIAFSHIHLYVDHVEDVSVYKDLEHKLNRFDMEKKKKHKNNPKATEEEEDISPYRTLYHGLDNNEISPQEEQDEFFEPQNRDVVKQLVSGLGFRVTGARMPSAEENTETINTRSVLVTTRDAKGVQMIVTSLMKDVNEENNKQQQQDAYHHFDATNLNRFYSAHNNRQGIAVLGFEVSSVDDLYARYMDKHPSLVLGKYHYEQEAKILEVFAYYNGDTADSGVDKGTVLRFVEPLLAGGMNQDYCIVSGLIPIEATFDDSCHGAYCDHWVSNVVSRTSFLNTLEDTLGFTPKVDFNAGVVAAGEAQIESTVSGNDASLLSTSNKNVILRDQRQVYLPINNALSQVGHVHGFLQEIGQGVQHIASRVDNLIDFVQRGNDYRKITGEGFTFLRIPRSYYGILTKEDLLQPSQHDDSSTVLSESCARAVLEACEKSNIVLEDYAVDLKLSGKDIESILDSTLTGSHLQEYRSNKQQVVDCILRSRYTNLYNLLGDHLSEERYLGIVRNQILVDVQGEDLLFQIFTSNILQRIAGEEAPFFEFIQRVCSDCTDENGCPAELKPGCGGFGIRNFLTLFLSIEVSKAMNEAFTAKSQGDKDRYMYAQQMVECFTDQLNESNPILTEISDAMTLEGKCRDELQKVQNEKAAANNWRVQMESAAQAKAVGNAKLMECSAKYKNLMKSIREGYTRNSNSVNLKTA